MFNRILSLPLHVLVVIVMVVGVLGLVAVNRVVPHPDRWVEVISQEEQGVDGLCTSVVEGSKSSGKRSVIYTETIQAPCGTVGQTIKVPR